MEHHQTLLEIERRRVARCEELIGKQEKLIERLRLNLRRTLDAEDLLFIMRRKLEVLREDAALKNRKAANDRRQGPGGRLYMRSPDERIPASRDKAGRTDACGPNSAKRPARARPRIWM